jgi:hypothetical protein
MRRQCLVLLLAGIERTVCDKRTPSGASGNCDTCSTVLLPRHLYIYTGLLEEFGCDTLCHGAAVIRRRTDM